MTRPYLAAEAGDGRAERRSLVLAGGGMRVAYQAGVLAALEEQGLRFHHVDGTSGGTINLSMLLSGQDVSEMCDRWRALDPRGFSAPLPWTDYLRSPHWPGLGGGDGIRHRVFPSLGIDAAAIRRADGVAGTYNVCNFATKTAEVFGHAEIDEDLLVAAVSLPVLMPAVERRGVPYTDAVWIRDSNVPEAVARGSDEVWLVWCIGNTPRYQNGSFRQYVHMIEMAANGSLLGDLRHLAGRPDAAPLQLHVIKPSRPIPLDPDYFLGRVDAAALIGMGYLDARAYLGDPRPLTAPWPPGVTAMSPAEAGVAARLVLDGSFRWGSPAADGRAGNLRVHLRLETSHPFGSDQMTGRLDMDAVGDVSVPGWPDHQLIEEGTVRFGGPDGVAMDLAVATASGRFRLRGAAAGGTLTVTVEEGGGSATGHGTLPWGRPERLRLTSTLHATNSPSSAAGWRAKTAAARILWPAGAR